MKRAICFVVNPIAGMRKDKSRLVHYLHDACQAHRVDFVFTAARGDATRLAQEAAQRGFDTVVAVGGDGTVNEVATALCGKDICMGIIPIGSGNGLARSLRIPLSYRRAVDVLLHGRPMPIDMGRMAHRYFCAVAGVGLDAVVGHAFDHTSFRGPVPYFLITAREIFRYKPVPVSIEFDHQQLHIEPFLLTFANTQQFGNGAIIAPQAVCNDGYLDLCLVPQLPLSDILISLPRLFAGTLDQHKKVQYYRIQRATLTMSAPIRFHVDGEPDCTENSRLDVEVLPAALNVYVPNASAAGGSHG